jgi:serine/threonine protein kinase
MTTVFQRVRVGPYEIGHEVGRGGMAVVFVATDSRDGRCVALKLVPAATNRDAQEVLAAERWGAKLQEQFCRVSQHVPVVYEHGTEGGYFYIAMEYIEGQNLSEVLTAGALAPGRAVNIAIQLCHFLEAAHGFESTIDGRNLRSLLHGDLKPRNIRVLRADKVKVLDFGIAKALSLSRHATRNNFGSITYVSPERLESGEIDAYADYWSVGVLLYEMLSGVQPFRAPDTRGLELRIRSERPPEPLGAPCPPGCGRWSPSSWRDVRPIDTAMAAPFARISNVSCRVARPRPSAKDGLAMARRTTSHRRRRHGLRCRRTRAPRDYCRELRRSRARWRSRRPTSSFGPRTCTRRRSRGARLLGSCRSRCCCSRSSSSDTSWRLRRGRSG